MSVEWTNMSVELMCRFRKYVEKAGTEWMSSALDQEEDAENG